MTTAHVYRFFGADDELLYIGCSTVVEQRVAHHRTQAPFRDLITRHEIGTAMDVDDANREEQRLILELQPPWNTQHKSEGHIIDVRRPDAFRPVMCQWAGCRRAVYRSKKLCLAHLNARYGNEGRGGARPNLTAEQRAEIKRRLSRFENPLALAKEFGVARKTVLRIGAS